MSNLHFKNDTSEVYSTSIAEGITLLLKSYQAGKLPSANTLSKYLRISRHTLSKAFKKIDNSRIFQLEKSKNNLTYNKQPNSLTNDSKTLLYNQIKDFIIQGKWNSGDSLPKIGFFCHSMSISNHTVQKVYHRLIDEGLVYKDGKQFIIGPKRIGPQKNIIHYIGLVEPKSFTWQRFLRMERAREFCRRFDDESDRYNVRTLTFAETILLNDPQVYPIKPNIVHQLIHELGDQYKGTLIIGQQHEYQNFDDVANLFRSLKLPTVWFDRTAQSICKPIKYFIHARTDERNIVDAALEKLHFYGHKRVLYPIWDIQNWSTIRFELLKNRASHYSIDIECTEPLLTRVDNLIDSLTKDNSLHFLEILRKFNLSNQTLRTISNLLEKLKSFPDRKALLDLSKALQRDESIMFTELFSEQLNSENPPTAIIAPNDWYGHKYYQTLTTFGYQIPKDISLISFDNERGLIRLPLSSVDFGFGELGYRAFHLIMGNNHQDKISSNGRLESKPYVVDRGSICPVIH